MAFQQALADGIKDYFQENSELAADHQKKIIALQKYLSENKTTGIQLPDAKALGNKTQQLFY